MADTGDRTRFLAYDAAVSARENSAGDRPSASTAQSHTPAASTSATQRPRVTLKDIARVAGVAHGTVSKALNGSPEVGPATRARITAIADRLGYRPNTIARSLKSRRTHTLGVITNDSDGVFTTAMVRGVAELASEHGFGVFVCNSYDVVAKEQQHLELLLDKQVDAIIMVGYKVAERGAPAAATGETPVVYLYEYTRATDAACILPDDEEGEYLATDHLIRLGRHRPAFVNGPPNYEATHLRLAGYKRSLTEHSLPVDDRLIVTAPDWNQDSGFRLAQQLMRRDNPPDALVCANDDLAAGAILGLHELGQRVPHDVAVIGFDDRPFAAHLPTPLTTIALPLHDMGVLAARQIFAQLSGEQTGDHIIRVPCRLVVRDTCGARAQPPPTRS